MYGTMMAGFLEFLLLQMPRTVVATCSAGIALFGIGLLAAKNEVVRARGARKIVALSNLFFAVPLAVFGAEHLSSAKFIMAQVPAYMPWRLFWAYFVGVALLAASLSIATKIQVRWSGLLFGIMICLFVAMLHIPSVVANPRDRILWVVAIRDMAFAGGGWILAANALDTSRKQRRSKLVT